MHQISIFNALRLSQENIASLISGATTAAITPTSLDPNRTFALFSEDDDGKIKIQCWAICVFCQILDKDTPLEIIALHTNASLEYLQTLLNKSERIILAYLRVYRLPTAIEIFSQAIGNFIQLSNSISVNNGLPLLSDRDFEIQKQRLLNLQPPESFIEKIERKLEESNTQLKLDFSKKTGWIQTISTLGDRSIELEEKKNAWQAGTDFENIAKKGLEFLGFTIDESHKGGAGGLDLFCSKPYPLIGECKAGKSIPSGTTEELIKLGGMRLEIENFRDSTKLIIGAGNPTPDVITAAYKWKVSIIKAMTLQKLVELKAKYDGAINLFELKEYLQAGQIDDKINEYIQKVESDIKLRSHIVQIVKEEQDETQDVSVTEIRSTYNAKYVKFPEPKLIDSVVKDLLIELSSPLAGYLGRVEEKGKKCDRFYYLRDLPCNT